MERAERIVLLCIGLLFDSILVPVLWVMLVLTVVTAVQRFVKVWRQAGVAPVVMERQAARAVPAAVAPLGAPGALQRPAPSPAVLARPAPRSPSMSHGPGPRLRPHRPARLPGRRPLAAQNLPEPVTSFVGVDARRRLRRRHARPAVDDRAPPAPGRPVAARAPRCAGRPRPRSTTTPATGWRASACPGCTAEEVDARLLLRGLRARRRRARPPAAASIVALPHLGGWEWAGRWIADQGLADHRRGRAARAAGAVRVVRRRSAARSA